jgi:GT2 family glycosyltransferase
LLFKGSRLFHGVRADPGRFDVSGPVECIVGAFMLMRRSDWTAMSGFDDAVFMYYEDVDYCARVHEAGMEVWYQADARMVHHAGFSSGQQRDSNLDLLKGPVLWLFFRRHRGRAAAMAATGIIVLQAVFRALVAPFAAVARREAVTTAVSRQLATSAGLLGWVVSGRPVSTRPAQRKGGWSHG